MKEKFNPLLILPGVDKDNTALSTQHYTDAYGIRFYNGSPQKLGGWDQFTFDSGATISGCTRTIYSQRITNTLWTLYGTNSYLYANSGTSLVNITPLETTTTNLRTQTTLGNNPLATTNLSVTVVVTHTSHGMTNGVTIALSGVPGDVNGIPVAELNNTHVITYINANSYSIAVTTPASSTASGGGAAVVETHGNLNTNYGTLANNPITTVNGSNTLTITHTAHVLEAGDSITLSGSSTVNGVPNTDINATHIVRTVSTNSYTIIVATSATSSGSGGGASVIEATPVITVTESAHGRLDGDRVLILAATAIGGIPDTEINIEHIIRNVTTNTYDFVAVTKATSYATGAGGAVTTVQGQIPEGECDASFGQGYGMGEYGVGEYGVSKTSTNLLVTPRIWSHDRFGNNTIMTPGGQTALYQWTGSTLVAPALITNAPTAINYTFTDNNIIVTLGEDNTPNRLKWSDQGASTVWTATSTNQAGEDDIEGAGQFISQANVRGINLIFTNNEVYTMQYIGKPLIWKVQKIDNAQGLVAQNARVVYNGICYWMGQNDFYMYNGGVVRSIPSNSSNSVNYLKNYVFNDINQTQISKSFAWFNPFFKEIWFHYPTSDSNEPNAIARWNVEEQHWVPDVMDRTAAEYPQILLIYPKLISDANNVYRHEKGVNDVDSALPFSLTSPYFMAENTLTQITGLIPDSIQTEEIDLQIKTIPYPQSTQVKYASSNGTNTSTPSSFTIEPTTEKVDFFITNRLWQYIISQDVVDGDWRMGQWLEEISKGTPH